MHAVVDDHEHRVVVGVGESIEHHRRLIVRVDHHPPRAQRPLEHTALGLVLDPRPRLVSEHQPSCLSVDVLLGRKSALPR